MRPHPWSYHVNPLQKMRSNSSASSRPYTYHLYICGSAFLPSFPLEQPFPPFNHFSKISCLVAFSSPPSNFLCPPLLSIIFFTFLNIFQSSASARFFCLFPFFPLLNLPLPYIHTLIIIFQPHQTCSSPPQKNLYFPFHFEFKSNTSLHYFLPWFSLFCPLVILTIICSRVVAAHTQSWGEDSRGITFHHSEIQTIKHTHTHSLRELTARITYLE